jgi:ribosomal subunit interface protein
MTSPSAKAVNTEMDLLEVSPEVKSYIYQSILEFEQFSTPNTTVAVIAKDPLKLISNGNGAGAGYSKEILKTMHRISISMVEDGAKIEAEGVAEDIYNAIRIAKEKLIKQLCQIQDEIVSAQDRKIQIDNAVGGSHVH